jgi:hypothetical protein
LGSLKELYEFAGKYGYDLLADFVLAKYATLDKQRRESGGIQRVG